VCRWCGRCAVRGGVWCVGSLVGVLYVAAWQLTAGVWPSAKSSM